MSLRRLHFRGADQIRENGARQAAGHVYDLLGGMLLGVGDWALAWASLDVNHNKRVLVSITGNPRKIVPLNGELPGYGLDNFVMADGGFISIRCSQPGSKRAATYRLSVYQIKNGRAKLLPPGSKASRFAFWSGVEIPQPPGAQAEFREDGSVPLGVYEFNATGRALLHTYAELPQFGDRTSGSVVFEWNLATRQWTRLAVPGHDDKMLVNAFYAGTCLFVNGGGSEGWWCRTTGGRWLDLGDICIAGRDGGTDLMVSRNLASYAQVVRVQ